MRPTLGRHERARSARPTDAASEGDVHAWRAIRASLARTRQELLDAGRDMPRDANGLVRRLCDLAKSACAMQDERVRAAHLPDRDGLREEADGLSGDAMAVALWCVDAALKRLPDAQVPEDERTRHLAGLTAAYARLRASQRAEHDAMREAADAMSDEELRRASSADRTRKGGARARARMRDEERNGLAEGARNGLTLVAEVHGEAHDGGDGGPTAGADVHGEVQCGPPDAEVQAEAGEGGERT